MYFNEDDPCHYKILKTDEYIQIMLKEKIVKFLRMTKLEEDKRDLECLKSILKSINDYAKSSKEPERIETYYESFCYRQGSIYNNEKSISKNQR